LWKKVDDGRELVSHASLNDDDLPSIHHATGTTSVRTSPDVLHIHSTSLTLPFWPTSRPQQQTASSVVFTESQPSAESTNAGSLRLRGHHAERIKDGKGVKWVEGTVDNEGLGRKKSKSLSFLSSLPFLFALKAMPL
jgi:hypothetical protein